MTGACYVTVAPWIEKKSMRIVPPLTLIQYFLLSLRPGAFALKYTANRLAHRIPG
jgi:hypothetical protein